MARSEDGSEVLTNCGSDVFKNADSDVLIKGGSGFFCGIVCLFSEGSHVVTVKLSLFLYDRLVLFPLS